MTFDDFMEVLGIKEEYQIKDRVMQILLSEEKNTFFKNLIEIGFETSKDEIRDIFESNLANRKSLKQDYTVLGMYSSKEKAMKVMDMIQKQIEDILKSDICDASYFKSNFVFKMPKDEDI